MSEETKPIPPEIRPKPVRVGGVMMYEYAIMKNGKRFISVEDYRKRYINEDGNVKSKAVIQYKHNGEKVHRYNSLAQAYAMTGVQTGHISNCCRGID